MKAIAQNTIAKLNKATATCGSAWSAAADHAGLAEVARQGDEFDGVVLFKPQRGGHVTLWFGSDYPDQGFDDNLDIWE